MITTEKRCRLLANSRSDRKHRSDPRSHHRWCLETEPSKKISHSGRRYHASKRSTETSWWVYRRKPETWCRTRKEGEEPASNHTKQVEGEEGITRLTLHGFDRHQKPSCRSAAAILKRVAILGRDLTWFSLHKSPPLYNASPSRKVSSASKLDEQQTCNTVSRKRNYEILAWWLISKSCPH